MMARILTKRTEKELIELNKKCEDVLKHTMVVEYRMNIGLSKNGEGQYVLGYRVGKEMVEESFKNADEVNKKLLELLSLYGV